MSSINTKVTVKKRIIVNNHEYARVEEMPDELRKAYESAIAGVGAGQANGASGSKLKIVFNGHEYASEESMPPEERQLYDAALASLKTDGTGAGTIDPQEDRMLTLRQTTTPIEPSTGGSTHSRSRIFLAIIGGLALLVIYYALTHGF